jgi:ABC-2 type transport system permease protein
MSEDRRNKTDQSLLTAPLYLGTIVFGKFFAAAIVYTAGISITLVYAILLNSFAPITWAIIWGNYIALLLLGFAFISIGQLISAMTENQAIAAIGCFGAMLAILLLDVIPQMMPTSRLGMVFGQISFIRRYSIITNGVLGFSDLFFFISVAGIFIFLTTRVLEKRRWS